MAQIKSLAWERLYAEGVAIKKKKEKKGEEEEEGAEGERRGRRQRRRRGVPLWLSKLRRHCCGAGRIPVSGGLPHATDTAPPRPLPKRIFNLSRMSEIQIETR